MSSSKSQAPLAVDPSAFISLAEWHYPLSPARAPAEVVSAIRPLPQSIADAIASALSNCQLEADHRAIQPGDFDFFSLPGKYRIAGTLSASPTVPVSEVEEWLRHHLFSHSEPSTELWCVSASYNEAFCVPPEIFIKYWDCLCGVSCEAAEIYPPGGRWILVWEKDYRRFVFYRRNPRID
jgi:hypothetical protein